MAYALRHPYRWSAALGFLTGIAEVVAGAVGLNPALTADGLHAIADGFANAVAAIVAERGNGWRSRGARVNGAFLIAGSLWVASEAIGAIIAGGAVPTATSIVIAVAGLAANRGQQWLVSRDRNHDDLRQSTLDHIGGDLRGSVIVVGVGFAAHALRWLCGLFSLARCAAATSFLVPIAALWLAGWLAKHGVRWIAGVQSSCDHSH